MQLFMVYLGGRVSGCHIEMHDVRFVVAEQIEDAYGQLKAQWVGDKSQVHMDSYMAVRHVDGFDVEVVDTPVEQAHKLYFVNLGAYRPDSLAEQHEFALVVATGAEEAKNLAKQRLLTGLSHQHKDNLHEVDDCLALDLIDAHYLKLTPGGRSQPIRPDWFGYHIL